jgi:hypothetical protein
MLMDEYNFVFETSAYGTDYNKHTKDISALVLAGEDAYEMIYGHVVGTCNNALIGDYMNLYTLPHLNFDAPWWPTQSVDEMTIFDCMYTITCSATYSQLASAKVVFFNKDLADQYSLKDPYELVRNGEWTIDALIEQSSGIYQDTNGDGVQDPGDVYGYTTIPMQNGFFVSTNTPILAPTADGGKEIAVMTERTVSLVEKLYSWYYESGNVFLTVTDIKDPAYCAGIFAAGNAAMTFGKLAHASQFYRDSEVSYGILPQPKYDTAQEQYYTVPFEAYSIYQLPCTLPLEDFEYVGVIMEALNAESWKTVSLTYYDEAMKGRYSTDETTAEIIDLIMASRLFEWGYQVAIFAPGYAKTPFVFACQIANNNVDLASTLAEEWEKSMDALYLCIEFYDDEYVNPLLLENGGN